MNFRERLKKNREERQEKRRRMRERAAPLLEYESLEGEYREWKRREEGDREEGEEEEGGMVEKREQMIEKREQMVFSSPSRSRSSLQKFCFEKRKEGRRVYGRQKSVSHLIQEQSKPKEHPKQLQQK